MNAIGSILHSYYNGLENIFSLIGKHIDNATFSSQKWHKELLNSMFSETERRKPVLDENIHEQLLDYMSFRHSYGYELDWERLKPLFFSITGNWANALSSTISGKEAIGDRMGKACDRAVNSTIDTAGNAWDYTIDKLSDGIVWTYNNASSLSNSSDDED